MANDQGNRGTQGGGTHTDQDHAPHDREKMSDTGHKGGQSTGGNPKDDPQRGADEGKQGGMMSEGDMTHDRDKASDTGRMGGQHRHDDGHTHDKDH